MASIRIREGSTSDKAALEALLRGICEEFNWRYEEAFEKHDSDPTYYRRMGGRLLVAMHNRRLVGTIGYLSKDRIAMLVRFYVVPEYRHLGIGKQLYLALLKELRRRNFEVVFLGTESGNICYLRPFLRGDDFIITHRTPMTFPNEVSSLYYQAMLL